MRKSTLFKLDMVAVTAEIAKQGGTLLALSYGGGTKANILVELLDKAVLWRWRVKNSDIESTQEFAHREGEDAAGPALIRAFFAYREATNTIIDNLYLVK